MQVGDWVVVKHTGKQGPVLSLCRVRDEETGNFGQRAIVLVRCSIQPTDRLDVKVAYDPADLVPVPVRQ